MIEFTHENTRYKVKPENAQAIRATLAKPKKYTCEAHKAVKRGFPMFVAGMSTADYVRAYQNMNNKIMPWGWQALTEHVSQAQGEDTFEVEA